MANPLYGQNKFDNFTEKQFASFAVTLGTATNNDAYWTAPKICKVTKVYSAIGAALTTADETLVVKSGQGTLGTITITQSGSAAGDVDSIAPTSNNVLDAGDYIHIDIGGENGTGCQAVITIVIEDA